MQKDSLRQIFRASGHFFSGTMLSRLSGLARDIVMAYTFGTQGAIAAFLVAFRFSQLFRRLLGEGAMQSAFIPHFETLRHEDPRRADRFFRHLTAQLTLFLAFGILLALIFGSFFVTPDDSILLLTLLMLPGLLFICLYGLNTAYLQCQGRYFTSSLAPVAFNAVWILGLLALQHLPPDQAMPYLAAFIVAACLGQALFTLPGVWPVLKEMRLSTFRTAWSSQDVRRLLKPLSLGILGVAATQINSAVDALFARAAEPEGPAFLWYAIRVQQLPLALFGIALSTALLPPLSRALQADDHTRYNRTLAAALKTGIAIMLPALALLLLTGDQVIHLLFGRGDFTDASGAGTTWCLWAYSLGLPFMAIVLLLAPAFYARKNWSAPTTATAVSVGLNMLLNGVFIFGLGWGAASVALATSVSSVCNCAMLFRAYQRSYGTSLTLPLTRFTVQATAATLLASGMLLACQTLLFGTPTALLLMQNHAPESASSVRQLLALTLQGGVFAIPLGLFAWKIKDRMYRPAEG